MTLSPRSAELGKTLSLLWLFAILNILFRDIHEMTMASTINEILSGTFNGNPVTEEVLFASAFAVELLLLAFLLSRLLRPRWSRWLNLGLAPLAIVGTFFLPPSDLDDGFFATVEVITFVVIFGLAWRWQTEATTVRVSGGHHAH